MPAPIFQPRVRRAFHSGHMPFAGIMQGVARPCQSIGKKLHAVIEAAAQGVGDIHVVPYAVLRGIEPAEKEALAGQQWGAVQYVRVKATPSLASRST